VVEGITSKGKLGGGVSAGLVVSDQTQDLAEARHGQQTTVLRVCNLPYLAQDCWCKLGALKELDGNLARYDAQLLCVGLLEEILEGALLLWGEVKDGLVCAWLAWAPVINTNTPVSEASTYSIQHFVRGPPWLCSVKRRLFARGKAEKPAVMRLKLPALSCNSAGKL
jgi:hypothetical protein